MIRDSNIVQTITKPSSTNTITDPKVFNLSSRNRTACEIQLLSKGLKYTPTPQRNHHELKTDIKSYTRRLRLREFFYKDECEEELSPSTVQHTPEDLVRNHSNFIPKHGRNRTLDAVCDTLENINLPDTGIHYSKPNLSKNEQNALKDLRNDRSIIMKEADKGGE